MARTKDFDVEAALDRAIEVFWEKGYEGDVPCANCEDRMGIGRQSLYDTFGDKQQLYLAAMDLYSARNGAELKATLGKADAALPELRAYFSNFARMLAKDPKRRGCMMTNAILEGGEDDAIVSRCQKNERSMQRVFKDALERAKDRGQLRQDTSTTAASTLLMGQMYGMTVLAKSGSSAAALQRVVDHVFDSL